MDTSSDTPASQNIPKGLMFKLPKTDYKLETRGDGRDSSKLSFDKKTLVICSGLSLAWTVLVSAYSMGMLSSAQGVIASYVFVSLGMITLFPIALIWAGFFVYHYANQSHKANSAILEAARILSSPALIAAEDVKTLSSAVGHELNKLRGEMRSIEDQMNNISERINTEVTHLNTSSENLKETLGTISGAISAERDSVVDLMHIVKKENESYRGHAGTQNVAYVQPQTPEQPPQEQISQLLQQETPQFTPQIDVPQMVVQPIPEQPQASIEPQSKSAQNSSQGYFSHKPEATILKHERQLYEGICALTVDLNRELGIELPQNLWSRYMRGERHVFAEYLVDALQHNFEAYRSKMQTEDLYKLCNQFVARFEALRERLSDKQDPTISEFLQNSGVGKIYAILSAEYV